MVSSHPKSRCNALVSPLRRTYSTALPSGRVVGLYKGQRPNSDVFVSVGLGSPPAFPFRRQKPIAFSRSRSGHGNDSKIPAKYQANTPQGCPKCIFMGKNLRISNNYSTFAPQRFANKINKQ